jgi:hypothetical protein
MFVLANNDYTDDIWEYFDPSVKFIEEARNLKDTDSVLIRYTPCIYTFLENLKDYTCTVVLYGFKVSDITTDIGDHFVFTNRKSFNEGVSRYTREFCQYLPELPLITQKVIDTDITHQSTSTNVGIIFNSAWDTPLMINKVTSLILGIQDMYSNVIINFICIDTESSSSIAVRDLHKTHNNSVYFEYTRHKVTELLQFMNSLDIIISGNYHASLLSLHLGIPTISLSTEEMHYIETDFNGCHITLPSNNEIPCNIPIYEILKAISNIKTETFLDLYTETFNYTDDNFRFHKRTTAPFYISSKDRESMIHSIIESVSSITGQSSISLHSGDRLMVNDPCETTLNSITQEILYIITGDPYGPLFSSVKNDLFIGPFKSLLCKFITIYYLKFNKPKNVINGSCFSGDFPDKQDCILDMYVEKTFNWNRDFYMKKGIIPYKTPWIGYIHHESTLDKLQSNPFFIESLKTCKRLIKSSELPKPISIPMLTFSIQRFHDNKTKKLINITSNPSNVSDFYELYISGHSWVYEKCLTKSIHPSKFSLPLIAQLDQPIQFTGSETVLYGSSMMYTIIKKLLNNVSIIHTENMNHFDDLLSNNVVFIEYQEDSLVLFDVISCIVRNTPVIIKKNDVTVSLLGEYYPLYYTEENIEEIMVNTQYLDITYEYLTNLDKTPFTNAYFEKYISE